MTGDGITGLSGRIGAGGSLIWRGYCGDYGPDGTRAELFHGLGPDAEGRPRVYIFTIETRRDLRGQGRATALLRRICQDADDEGVTLYLLPLPDDAHMEPRLRAWYARHGFRDLPPVNGKVGMERPPRASLDPVASGRVRLRVAG